MKTIYTFIDLETTGLDAKNDQIIEIGAVRTDLDIVYTTFYTTVGLYRTNKLPAFIKELTKINEDDLMHGMDIHSAITMIKKIIENSVVVAHYVPFDFSFLHEFGIHPPRFVCTKFLSGVLFPDQKSNLVEMTQFLGISHDHHHRALSDVNATMILFKKLKPMAEDIGIDYENKVGVYPYRHLTFIPKFTKEVVPQW